MEHLEQLSIISAPSPFSFIVCLGASKPAKLMSRYLNQLTTSSIPYHITTLILTSPSDGRMGLCVAYYRQLAQEFSSHSRLIITDAWDVLCYGSYEDIASILISIPPTVLFAAERNCYPEPELASVISAHWNSTQGSIPWLYANGGMLTASPAELLLWCDLVERHPAYDPDMIGQQWLNRRLTEGSELVSIDSRTNLFYCMYMEDQSPALRNVAGMPHNILTNTFPKFIHFNGSWPWDHFLGMMEDQEAL